MRVTQKNIINEIHEQLGVDVDIFKIDGTYYWTDPVYMSVAECTVLFFTSETSMHTMHLTGHSVEEWVGIFAILLKENEDEIASGQATARQPNPITIKLSV